MRTKQSMFYNDIPGSKFNCVVVLGCHDGKLDSCDAGKNVSVSRYKLRSERPRSGLVILKDGISDDDDARSDDVSDAAVLNNNDELVDNINEVDDSNGNNDADMVKPLFVILPVEVN